MRSRTALACCVVVTSLVMPVTRADSVPNKKIRLTDTQHFDFAPCGVITLDDSFGEVVVKGWDRPEVEITTVRATQKHYPVDRQAAARTELERIRITASKRGDHELVISTIFPSRSLFKRPLRGKSNLQLEYHIQAPQQSKLVIHHDEGEVRVINLRGDLEITNHIGQIELQLPETDEYTIDAKSRIGDVSSEFSGITRRKFLLGEHFGRDGRSTAHQLYLRVGIGDISIHKLADKVASAAFPSPPSY